MALTPLGSGPGLAWDPGLQPPPSLSVADPASETQAHCPAATEDLGTGPCWWEEETYWDDGYESSYYAEAKTESPQEPVDLEDEGWSYHDDVCGYEEADEAAIEQQESYTPDDYDYEAYWEEEYGDALQAEADEEDTDYAAANDDYEYDYDGYGYEYDGYEYDGYDEAYYGGYDDTYDEYDAYEYDAYEDEPLQEEQEAEKETVADDFDDEYDYDECGSDGYEYAYDEDWDRYESEYGYESWEYGYGEYEAGEYDDVSPEPRYASDAAPDSSPEQQPVATEDETVYEGYSDAYPEEEFAYPEQSAHDVAGDTQGDSWYDDAEAWDEEFDYGEDQYGYEEDYADERDGDDGDDELLQGEASDGYSDVDSSEQYEELYWDEYGGPYGYEYVYEGYEYSDDEIDDWQEGSRPQEEVVAGLELFAWRPAELLSCADQQWLRTLAELGGEPSGVRRAKLNAYLEELGWEAIDFAFRFEDVTGTEALGLADDLSSTAALLATFRLVEQGELGMDEGVEVLRRTLEDVTLDWIEGIDEITGNTYEPWVPSVAQAAAPADRPFDPTRLENPVVEAIVSLASETLGEVGDSILGVTERLAELGWEPAPLKPAGGRPARRAAAAKTPPTR